MEFRKNSEKFAFGFGTKRTAGKGNLNSETLIKNQNDSAEIAGIAAAAGTAVLMISWKAIKFFNKNKK